MNEKGNPLSLVLTLYKIQIRNHMNTSGFGGQDFLGNGAAGFKATQLPFQFAPWIGTFKPLPDL